jgi:hypothetical protein
MNARTALPPVARHSLEALLVEGRTPLDAALQLAHVLVKALEEQHASGRALGVFDASSISLDGLGHVVVKPSLRTELAAPELSGGAEADLLSDLFSLGAVYYRLFSGQSHLEAQKRSAGVLPPPSRFNPTIDDTLDALVLTLLDADPMQRPYRLAQVEGSLVAVCEEMGLETDGRAIAAWVSAHRPQISVPLARMTPAAPVKAVAVRKPAPPIQWSLEEEDDDAAPETADVAWEGPIRFDLWAAASAGVLALGVAIIALM